MEAYTLTAEHATEQRTDQAQEQIEARNRLGQNPTHKPRTRTDPIPAAKALEVLLGRCVGAGPKLEVHVLGGHRSVHDAGYDDGRECDAKGDLGNERACRAKCRTGNEGAGVVVYEY